MTDTIKADLERLFPTGCGDHFLAPARQELLLSVLSLWADLNTATAYRQVSRSQTRPDRVCVPCRLETHMATAVAAAQPCVCLSVCLNFATET